jgi:dihydrofolate synthase/folylpolyglutamate synthase
MRALTESLPELSRGRAPVVAVVSVLDDKDAAGMLAELMPACDRLVLTATQNPRVLPPATLKSLAAQLDGPPAEVVGDPWRALARARELAAPGGLVVVTGSQYLIGDLLAGGRRERASSL